MRQQQRRVQAPLGARGTLWLSLYALLVLAPLAVAVVSDPYPNARPWLVEASVALGFIATPVILAQFALVSRQGTISRLFGNDALLQFHRGMGFTALAFAVGHPLLLNLQGLPLSTWSPFSGGAVTRSGALATLALVILVATTVLRRRLRLSYEGWRSVHVGLAVVIVAALAAHVVVVGGYGATTAGRVLLVAYVAAFGALLAIYRVIRPMAMRRKPWEVAENVDIGGATRLLRVRPVGHPGFDFVAGQFAWLVTGRSPFSREQHPLSFASSAERPSDGAIELAVKALGDWSGDVVPALTQKERVWVDGPFGAFSHERVDADGFVMIAGGIGVTPMRSMLLTLRDRGDRRPVLLVHAARDTDGLLFRRELESLRGTLGLEIVQVLESAPADWSGERGVVTRDLLLRYLPAEPTRYHYFVCGPRPMMDSVERILVETGVSRPRVHSERFDIV